MTISAQETITPKILALQLIYAINKQDLDGISELISKDHTFISKINDVQKGKTEMLKSWEQFFNLFHDYRIHISLIYSRVSNYVILFGKAESSNDLLKGPTIWTAYVNNNLISEWRIYDDNETSRNKLNISKDFLEPLT